MREPEVFAVVRAGHRDSHGQRPLWFRVADGAGTCWMGTNGTWATWPELIAPIAVRDGSTSWEDDMRKSDDAEKSTHCCGQPRDEDGRCVHRPHHPLGAPGCEPELQDYPVCSTCGYRHGRRA